MAVQIGGCSGEVAALVPSAEMINFNWTQHLGSDEPECLETFSAFRMFFLFELLLEFFGCVFPVDWLDGSGHNFIMTYLIANLV